MRRPRSKVQNFIFECLNKFVEPMLNCWPADKLRERAMNNLMEQINYNSETTEYIALCPVDKVNIKVNSILSKLAVDFENILSYSFSLLGIEHDLLLGRKSKFRCFPPTSFSSL
jgi:hypothetical protein